MLIQFFVKCKFDFSDSVQLYSHIYHTKISIILTCENMGYLRRKFLVLVYLLVDHMQILKFCTLRLSVKKINLEKKTVSAHAECFNKNNEK